MSISPNLSTVPPSILPQEIGFMKVIFPGSIERLMPKWDAIPEEFKDGHNPWVQFQEDWFSRGLMEPVFIQKPDVNQRDAFRHLGAIQGSYWPAHEYKTAAVAYLASLWFEEVRANGKIYKSDEVSA
jgi:hypothetical protein